jgi:hypothetical protein
LLHTQPRSEVIERLIHSIRDFFSVFPANVPEFSDKAQVVVNEKLRSKPVGI